MGAGAPTLTGSPLGAPAFDAPAPAREGEGFRDAFARNLIPECSPVASDGFEGLRADSRVLPPPPALHLENGPKSLDTNESYEATLQVDEEDEPSRGDAWERPLPERVST